MVFQQKWFLWKILVPRNFSGLEKFGIQKIVGLEKFKDLKYVWSKKILDHEKFKVPKILGPQGKKLLF